MALALHLMIQRAGLGIDDFVRERKLATYLSLIRRIDMTGEEMLRSKPARKYITQWLVISEFI